jgi:hypothetical protein
MHVSEREDDTCEWVHQNLGGYLRGGISRRDAAKVEDHLEECRPCLAIYLELTEVNSHLAAWLAPVVLGAAATGYLAAGSASVGTGVLVVGLLDRAKDVVAGHALASTAAGVAATVVIGGAVVIGTGPDDARLSSDPPRSDKGDQLVEPDDTTQPGPGRDRDRDQDRARKTRDRQPGPGRALPVVGPATDVPTDEESDDADEPDGGTLPGVDLPDDPDNPPDDGGEDPGPEVIQDVRLVVDAQRREGSATPITVAVVGLTGDQVGELTVTWDGPETVTNPPDTCQGTPLSSWTCAASAAATSFWFNVQSNDPGTVTFTITVAEGVDADPSNNTVTVPVAGNA